MEYSCSPANLDLVCRWGESWKSDPPAPISQVLTLPNSMNNYLRVVAMNSRHPVLTLPSLSHLSLLVWKGKTLWHMMSPFFMLASNSLISWRWILHANSSGVKIIQTQNMPNSYIDYFQLKLPKAWCNRFFFRLPAHRRQRGGLLIMKVWPRA